MNIYNVKLRGGEGWDHSIIKANAFGHISQTSFETSFPIAAENDSP